MITSRFSSLTKAESLIHNQTTKRFQTTTTTQEPSTLPLKPPKKVNYKVAERNFYDTHAFVKCLVENDFTQKQSEELCELFKDIVNYIADDIRNECVTKNGQVEKIFNGLSFLILFV